MSPKQIPVILVSASDKTVATKIISELIDNELEDNIYKEAGWRVWQLENKYYTAAVRLQALLDGEDLPQLQAEAHVIYLTGNEGEQVAESRNCRVAGLLRRGAVRLTLVDAADFTDTLVSWGLRARHELVALRGEEGGEEGEAGVGRARAALHAHVWPGLHRRDVTHEAPATDSGDEESSDGGSVGEEEEDEERAVERAEAFADALGVLAAISEQRDEPHDEQRRERAEHLVAAFCRALGRPLHDLPRC